eukprot:170035_1
MLSSHLKISKLSQKHTYVLLHCQLRIEPTHTHTQSNIKHHITYINIHQHTRNPLTMSINSIYQLATYVLFTLPIWTTNGKFIRGPFLTNWTDAKAFCDEQHQGLATITDAISLGAAQTECFKEGYSAMGCWFGLSAVLEQ